MGVTGALLLRPRSPCPSQSPAGDCALFPHLSICTEVTETLMSAGSALLQTPVKHGLGSCPMSWEPPCVIAPHPVPTGSSSGGTIP